MTDNHRYKTLITSLREQKLVRNQQDFAERIGYDKTTVSLIVHDRISIPNKMFTSIEQAFPQVSIEWLKTGEGEVFKSNEQLNDVYPDDLIARLFDEKKAVPYSLYLELQEEIKQLSKEIGKLEYQIEQLKRIRKTQT